MQIYLPIAQVSVNAFLLLGIGGIVGLISGMFGVGGGFLITPLLLFIGIPPGVAVASARRRLRQPQPQQSSSVAFLPSPVCAAT